jgi:hypothetical protein
MKDLFITGNQFKNICDDYIDESKSYIDLSKVPKIIFLYTDWLKLFEIKILPKLNYEFTLVTHNADHQIDERHLNVLNNSNLKKWYGMNCHIEHPKLHSIPIGIANEKWIHGNKEELEEIVNSDINRDSLCYSNFEISTNTNKRNNIFNIVKNKKFIDIETSKLPFKEYLLKLKKYKYVISPPGNSIDCHRIWESIYLGTIPIVEKHTALNFFNDLPILFVNSFEEVTEELLNDKTIYNDLKNKNKEKAYFNFYKERIKNDKNN